MSSKTIKSTSKSKTSSTSSKKKSRSRSTSQKQKSEVSLTSFIEDNITKVFSAETYSLVSKPDKYNIYTRNHSGDKNFLCVRFSIQYNDSFDRDSISIDEYKALDKTIYIDRISKCIGSGSDTLEKMNRIAKKLFAKSLNLEDDSQIRECETFTKLFIISILSTGESWYNSKGYYSQYYPQEIQNNRQIIQKNAIEFITECIEKIRQERIQGVPSLYKTLVRKYKALEEDLKEDWPEDLLRKLQQDYIYFEKKINNYDEDKEIKKINTELDNILYSVLVKNRGIFEINDDMTVQAYFTNVKRRLLSATDSTIKCKMYRFTYKLINLIDKCNIIKYYTEKLTKIV